jgi:hypothetical protein
VKIVKTPKILIYFGSTKDGLKQGAGSAPEAFLNIKSATKANGLFFLDQVHGVDAVVIGDDYTISNPLNLLDAKGDVLLTSRPGIGIGVLTADCLPVVLFDPKSHSIALAHAGWKGSVRSVVRRAAKMMKSRFKTKIENLVAYLGPSAKSCCYEISNDFAIKLRGVSASCVTSRDKKLFFDLPELNASQLVKLGLKEENIISEHNDCTICNHHYCSYRRSGHGAGRQATVVVLR